MRTLFFIAFLVMSLTGCKSDQIRQKPLDVGPECERLYQVYLDGGQAEAHDSLVEIIKLIEDAKLSPNAEAIGLWLANGRLFVLEKRSGNAAVSQSALVKARYWALRRAELSGDSPTDAMSYVEKFASEDGLVVFLDKWDRDHNDGHLPKYTQKP
jgi:hypothetical protein